jgi:DNA-binding transcriptional ArsR family regulator
MEESFHLCRVPGYSWSVDFVHPIEAIIPGAQGRVLSVLTNTTAELNLRTIAELSGISQAQASRVLPELVELGIVERREVPPSSLFRLVTEHVAFRALRILAHATDTVFDEIGRLANGLPIPPVSIIVFGSFARGEARTDSDIDIVVVRPRDVDEDDPRWGAPVEEWRRRVRRLTGNRVELLELDVNEAASRLAGPGDLWNAIRRDGHVVHGAALEDLESVRSA